MLVLVIAWVLASVFIGFMGRRQRFGFWGYFFGSMLLSPILGVLMLIGATPTPEQKKSYRR